MAMDAVATSEPRRRLLDLLDDACKFSPPAWLIEHEFREIRAMLDAQRKAGNLDPIDAAMSKRQLFKEYRAIAERRVRLGLVLAEIGKRHDISTSLEAPAYEDEVIDLIFGLAAVEQQ
jgi:trigger factor